jgi:hypothetical protein
MTGRYTKVKYIAGRKHATDDEIRELCKKGWFLHQIRLHYKIGLPRLRKIAREVEVASL